MRVKILFKQRESAFIQYATSQQAHLALVHLNKLNLYGKDMNISLSKHTEIAMPRADTDPESAALTKDFSGSKIHRFQHRVTRQKNIHPPSQVLHVSNLHEGATEEELRKLFGQDQQSAPAVQFFKKDKKMAYVRMESLQDAVYALLKLHNHRLGEKYMRVSFSSKDPNTIQDSDVAGGAEATGDEEKTDGDGLDDDLDAQAARGPKSAQVQEYEAKVDAELADQDLMIDAISKGIDDLKNIALDQNRALKTMGHVVDNLEKETVEATTIIQTQNQRLQEIIDAQGGLTRWCPVLICGIILLALAGYIFKMI